MDPAAVSENLRAMFVRIAERCREGRIRRFGSVLVASSGLPASVYNRVHVLDPATPRAVESAVAWLRDRGHPFQVTAAESTVGVVESVAPALDLTRVDVKPGMALALDDRSAPEGGPPVDVAPVTDVAGVDDFVAVCSAVFGTPAAVVRRAYAGVPDDAEGERRSRRAGAKAEDDRLFVGRVDSTPVSCAVLVRTGAVAGLYTVGVRESYRRRGIGEATSRAVLRAGREAGCRAGVLQAEAAGRALYERIGFEPVAEYHYFASAAPDAP